MRSLTFAKPFTAAAARDILAAAVEEANATFDAVEWGLLHGEIMQLRRFLATASSRRGAGRNAC